jgi:ribosomal protein S18 acetylase RimI-like enzyme
MQFRILLVRLLSMRLDLEELGCTRQIECEELDIRARHNPWTEQRLQYLVRSGGRAVAFVSFDMLPERDFIVLYELFVASRHRRRGIGSTLVAEAKRIASVRGYRRIIVRPAPLSEDVSEEVLTAWYQSLGFRLRASEPGTLEFEV